MAGSLAQRLAQHNYPKGSYSKEENLARACASWLRDAEGWGLLAPCMWFHVPNGGGRSRAEAGIFKAMGVRAGVPDLLFLWAGGWGCIELKVGKGRQSPAQEAFEAFAVKAGHHYSIARTVVEMIDALAAMQLLRGRMA